MKSVWVLTQTWIRSGFGVHDEGIYQQGYRCRPMLHLKEAPEKIPMMEISKEWSLLGRNETEK